MVAECLLPPVLLAATCKAISDIEPCYLKAHLHDTTSRIRFLSWRRYHISNVAMNWRTGIAVVKREQDLYKSWLELNGYYHKRSENSHQSLNQFKVNENLWECMRVDETRASSSFDCMGLNHCGVNTPNCFLFLFRCLDSFLSMWQDRLNLVHKMCITWLLLAAMSGERREIPRCNVSAKFGLVEAITDWHSTRFCIGLNGGLSCYCSRNANMFLQGYVYILPDSFPERREKHLPERCCFAQLLRVVHSVSDRCFVGLLRQAIRYSGNVAKVWLIQRQTSMKTWRQYNFTQRQRRL
jgi:hypothetical protein